MRMQSKARNLQWVSGFGEGSAQRATNFALIPVPGLAAYFLAGSESWLFYAFGGVAFGILAQASGWFGPAVRSYVLTFGLFAQCILFTAALSGHPWQVDSHMAFFAILAVVATLGSIGALLFGAGLVAFHHLAMGLWAPELIFPGGTASEAVGRVLLHAAIVVLQTAVLVSSIYKQQASDAEIDASRQDAEMQMQTAVTAQRHADDQRAEAKKVVQLLRERVASLESGSLDCQIAEDLGPEYRPLRDSFNSTAQRLAASIAEAKSIAEQTRQSGENIGGTSTALAERTASQAATLEQTTAALHELAGAVSNAASDATLASNTASDVSHGAGETGEMVGGAVTAMEAIKESSSRISTIIGVIDDIAFQTNLLALNAGVEAARAGEAGRGFAVVATEVRGLAQWSAEAAREIRGLIAASTTQVNEGAQLVEETGEAIARVVADISAITSSVSKISRDMNDQSGGLSEISTGISGLDTATQQNAAVADELKHDGADLNRLATNLGRIMDQFSSTTSVQAARAA